MKRIVLFGVAALLLLATAVLYFVQTQSRETERQAEVEETVSRKLISSKGIERRAKKVVRRKLLGKRAKSHNLPSVQDPDENWSPAEKKLADELQQALDDEDFAATQRLSLEAAKSENLQIVRRAVDALKWFGPKALPELTVLAAKCLEIAERARQRAKGSGRSSSSSSNSSGGSGGFSEAVGAEGGDEADLATTDAETAAEGMIEEAEDVLQMSMDAIEEKLGEIENDAEKAKLVSQYMKATSDEDMLTLLEGQLNTIPDEKLVIEAAVDVITTATGNAVEHAKAAYEFQTGEAYTDREAAQRYLDENYTPPEPE